jgi:cytoskeletal protein CcmA (bactofilin family)
MLTKQTESQPPLQPQQSNGTVVSSPKVLEAALEANRLHPSVTRSVSGLGTGLEIKGSITAEEDLQIDARVIGGPVIIEGHRLTVGRSAQLKAEVIARELIVYGKIEGNVNAIDRLEIKRDGEVIGDIQTARISIEDGAVFKGCIEVGTLRPKASASPKDSAVLVGAGVV